MKMQIIRDVRTAVYGRLFAGQVVEVDPGTGLDLLRNGDAVQAAVVAPVASVILPGGAVTKITKKPHTRRNKIARAMDAVEVAAVTLGKGLSAPSETFADAGKAGVEFTDEQKETIKKITAKPAAVKKPKASATKRAAGPTEDK